MDDILFEKIAYEMQAEAIKELKRCAEILNESCDPNRQDLGMYMMRIIGPVSYTHLDVYKRQVKTLHWFN